MTYFFVFEEYNDSAYIILNNKFEIKHVSKNSKEKLGIDRISYLKKPQIDEWLINFSSHIPELEEKKEAKLSIYFKN